MSPPSPNDLPKANMSPPSPNVHLDRDATHVESNASRAPSPYHELRQWDPYEDLIQLENPNSSRKKPYGRYESNQRAAMSSGTGRSSRG